MLIGNRTSWSFFGKAEDESIINRQKQWLCFRNAQATKLHEAGDDLIGLPASCFEPLMLTSPEVMEFALDPELSNEPFGGDHTDHQ